MGRFARRFQGTYELVSQDIYKFCDALRFTPNDHQKKLFNAVMRAEYGQGPLQIAVKSGQGTGKTTASVIVALWRAIRNVNALVILTAPTMRQCNEVWLAECRRVLDAADPFWKKLIVVTNTKVEIAGVRDWGVKTVTATKEENAQGFHEKNMTIICEEASGISRGIVEQFKGTASNPNCLFLMIGNPNTRDCAFFDCFNSLRRYWATLTFNAEHTPKSAWFDPIRNTQLAEEFGRDSDVYRIRVLGEFPHADPNCVISSEDLEKCTDKALLLPCVKQVRAYTTLMARQFGIDLARYGTDESTIFRRSGNAIVGWEKYAHTDPARVVERAFRMQVEAGWTDKNTWYVADAGGMGQGVMHKFHDAGKQIVEFHSNGKAIDRQYDNKMSEAWFSFARLARKQECYIPNDNLLIQQLSSRQYFTTKKGKLILESKDDYMKRGHESPDRADGCMLAFWDKVEAVGNVSGKGSSDIHPGTAVQI